jgi:ABC-type uncharacterized transport system auxiliary subunit
MSRRLALVFAICAGLTACGNVPPAPTEQFYRLQVVSASDPASGAALTVGRFSADSIYAERPMVHGNADNPHAVRQYHYQLWLYPPAQLVREHLAQALGARLADFSERRIEGRVLRFDRVGSSASAYAAVELELSVMQGREVVFLKRYMQQETVAGDGIPAHVQATERALAKIYARFLDDLRDRQQVQQH